MRNRLLPDVGPPDSEATLAPLRFSTLSEQVATRILRALESGDITVGGRLVEARLAELLGVSRAPVREALQQLEQQGLVRRLPHRGSFVARFAPEEIAEVFILRADLEALAARLALVRGRIRRKDTARLRTHVREMSDAVRTGRFTTLLDLDMDFHRLLAECSGSRRLVTILDNLRAHTRITIALANKNTKALRSIVQTHRSVVGALESGDAVRVDRETKRHVLETLDFLGIRTPTLERDRAAVQTDGAAETAKPRRRLSGEDESV